MQEKRYYEEQPSGWAVGTVIFAASMMIMLGIWWIFAGLVAIFDDNFYVVTQDWIYKIDTTTWGWIHLGFGIVTTIAGFSVFTGALWARIVGIVLAIAAALIAFAWLPYYPIWAILLIAVAVLVIWALTVYGREIKRT